MKNIRNFCIIAHIDHGKSTLADRLLEATKTVGLRDQKNQVLDNMDLERERGITIKSHAIQMAYAYKDESYLFHLIDTPGHVDFTYEVSRSIAACEGALLVVDAAQGVEAQTISNLYLALAQNLTIIPVLNKIDLPGAMPEEVKDQIIELIGCDRDEILSVSAKQGIGIDALLEGVVTRIPAPKGDPKAPLQAMIFDSLYNTFRGVEVYFRIFNGMIQPGDQIQCISTGIDYKVEEVGILKLQQIPQPFLAAGHVGYMIAGIKNASEVKVGDTITHIDKAGRPVGAIIKGFEAVKPMVFAGIYPVDSTEYEPLRDAIEKLKLNDAALIWEAESSAALGFGFRCGFLGMLHMEIIQERLEKEFNITIITTVPSVQFHVIDAKGQRIEVQAPADMPDPNTIDRIEEPLIKAQIITKAEFLGGIIKLCMDRRGILKNQLYLTTDRVELTFELPLAEVVFDFFDKLKTISRGYASLDYELARFADADLVKLDILLHNEKVDALSAIVHRSSAYERGKVLCKKLKEIIPKHMFEVSIQAAIGTKIIARETVKSLRKNVIAKCYGGDISRKRKLLEKQKKGKKRMKQVGSVEIPQEAFMAVLKLDD
ncbi:Elongation factor 4 [Cardinium endosymbiont cEper1 of Encarsia pergandiella]|uniref:translation elongation factor 4 n=1 Tax=Cardinium endosymbiont of Encarsia pergandiella TaxID=249402 RepID=UPI00027EA2AC|nr:translation elongation factor 4 [Cardinium endosymbiont of Encarsia pergandiella]CCM10222.1 Elongation factor 4 [Cardinium endosymbiont cEper1 of Encarsia pergandiella]